MSDERKDREAGDEEFEPLDTFFAPIEDVDWPEEGDEATGGATPPAAATSRPGASPPARGPDPSNPDPEDDFQVGDLAADPLAGIDLEEDELLPQAPEPAATAPDATAADATAELSGQDWEELRLDGSHEAAPAEAAAGPAETSWEREDSDLAFARPGADEPGEGSLTLEDMKSAPPEYADLPGPPEEESAMAAASGTTEPAAADVEAAADHFAEALRGEEPEPEPFPAPSGRGTAREPLPSPDMVEQDLLADLEREPSPPPTVSVGVTDTLAGPSWQEPTSEEVSTGGGPAMIRGRNLPLAFLSGIILVAIGIGAIAAGKGPFTVVAGAVIVLAQGELYAALHRKGYQPATALGLVFGGLISAAAYLRGESGALAMFALGCLFTFFWFMATPSKARHNTVANVAMTLLPLGYVALLASFLLTLLGAGGRSFTLAVIGLAVGNDIAAYAAGSLWGQRALAPSISPRKSWEGATIATLLTIIAAILILPSLDTWKLPLGTDASGFPQALGLGIVIAIFAPLGDLAESMLKRDLGIKDMGSLIPGHGGVLDRVDSILFAAPAAFYFLRLFLF
ncbi:MAG: phosphatidate cytidylyltransferase [Actinomycetota bacterium]